MSISKILRAGLLGGTAIAAMTAAASAADLSMKDAPVVEAARKLAISVNFSATSDYVFRGISQSAERPVVQGGVDVTYGMFYVGAWASGIDFNGKHDQVYQNDRVEMDIYAGIKPEWRKITFDLGIIGYTYNGTKATAAPGASVDYLELKAGASTTVLKDVAVGATVYYSPEGSGEIGEVWTVEGSVSKPLGKLSILDLAASGTVGHSAFESSAMTDYTYWNLGLTATAGKLSFDVRYWDTDLKKGENGWTNSAFQADERVVGTVKITLP